MQKQLTVQDYIGEDEMRLLIKDAFSMRERDSDETVNVFAGGRCIKPRTDGQVKYLAAIDDYEMTFCIGPAGTGKTYLAVAKAVEMLKAGEVKKIILVRPAVDAGEKLGFLPGDLLEKVNPYLRPLLDAFGDMMDTSQVKRLLADDVIEVIPLAFMRGRTLSNAVIICDEAQNVTKKQMLMLLTRLGHNAKMIITGDDQQIDLHYRDESGLVHAKQLLQNVAGIVFVYLQDSDIVRHPLVQRIVKAYEIETNRGE